MKAGDEKPRKGHVSLIRESISFSVKNMIEKSVNHIP